MSNPLQNLARKSGRYKVEAFSFLFEALDYAVQLAGRGEAEGSQRHVTGQELLAGMRYYATRMFGPMAAYVWRSWGIHDSMDWGRIVFLLVDEGMLNRQENDTIDDFRDGFDFDKIFRESYVPELPGEIGARPPEGGTA